MSEGQGLSQFVILSFIVQFMIVMVSMAANAGTTMTTNAVAEDIITGQTSEWAEDTDITIIEEGDLEELTNPVQSLIEDPIGWLFTLPSWIGKIGTVMFTLSVQYLTLSGQIAAYGTAAGGITGGLISMFGIVMLIWQMALAAKIISMILRRAT